MKTIWASSQKLLASIVSVSLASLSLAQPAGVLGRLQRHYHEYNLWASQRTFVWEIECVKVTDKNVLSKDQRLQDVVIITPARLSTIVRLEIVRTSKLTQITLQYLKGDWLYGNSKEFRYYIADEWMSKDIGEAKDLRTNRVVPTVQIIPVKRSGAVFLESVNLVGPMLHPTFFAGTSPFEREYACSTRPQWLVDTADRTRLWLKQVFHGGSVWLAFHPEGWVFEHQVRVGDEIVRRTTVVETQRHDGFVVPSKVVIELNSDFQRARLVARLMRLEKSRDVRVEHPLGAEVSDYRLMSAEEYCSDASDGTTKVVDYIWQGRLPTLDELRRMYQQANPQGSAVPIPSRRQNRWLLYLPGLVLIAVGVYLWWRGQRSKAMG